MRYFYILPFKGQYYFPPQYKSYKYMLSFYTPYTLKGRIVWWLWRKTVFFKFIFTTTESRIPQINLIKSLVGNHLKMAINTGTKGPEQKLTCIGFDEERNLAFFLKFATSDVAKGLVDNEYNVLSKLEKLSLEIEIPDILMFIEHSSGLMLQTSLLLGQKYTQTRINNEVLTLLKQISTVQFDDFVDKATDTTCKKQFAHGDFCPWNILITEKGLTLIDWEMAGIYPLGFDIFTFIFQTQLLLNSEKSVESIFLENKNYISLYFEIFQLEDWMPYLIEFSLIKTTEYQRKNNVILAKRFKEIENLKSLYAFNK